MIHPYSKRITRFPCPWVPKRSYTLNDIIVKVLFGFIWFAGLGPNFNSKQSHTEEVSKNRQENPQRVKKEENALPNLRQSMHALKYLLTPIFFHYVIRFYI
jgi:hypothetical protein